ncbi:hypothetical protein [Streptosporangium sp. NPDC002607]
MPAAMATPLPMPVPSGNGSPPIDLYTLLGAADDSYFTIKPVVEMRHEAIYSSAIMEVRHWISTFEWLRMVHPFVDSAQYARGSMSDSTTDLLTRRSLARRRSSFSVVWPDPGIRRQLSVAPYFSAPGVVVTPQAGFSVASRALRRRVISAAAFTVTLAACAEAALTYRDVAEVINLATGIDPWMIALLVSFLVGVAFDKLYPEKESE